MLHLPVCGIMLCHMCIQGIAYTVKRYLAHFRSQGTGYGTHLELVGIFGNTPAPIIILLVVKTDGELYHFAAYLISPFFLGADMCMLLSISINKHLNLCRKLSICSVLPYGIQYFTEPFIIVCQIF